MFSKFLDARYMRVFVCMYVNVCASARLCMCVFMSVCMRHSYENGSLN